MTNDQQKIDKRTKEYRDSQKVDTVDGSSDPIGELSRIALLEARVDAMERFLRGVLGVDWSRWEKGLSLGTRVSKVK